MASSLSVFSRSGKRFTSSLKDGESPCFSKRSEDYIREMREVKKDCGNTYRASFLSATALLFHCTSCNVDPFLLAQAETLVEKIRYNGGVEIKTRSYHLRSYYACFIGKAWAKNCSLLVILLENITFNFVRLLSIDGSRSMV